MKRRVKENEIANKKTRSFLVCHENGTSKLVRHTLTGKNCRKSRMIKRWTTFIRHKRLLLENFNV